MRAFRKDALKGNTTCRNLPDSKLPDIDGRLSFALYLEGLGEAPHHSILVAKPWLGAAR